MGQGPASVSAPCPGGPWLCGTHSSELRRSRHWSALGLTSIRPWRPWLTGCSRHRLPLLREALSETPPGFRHYSKSSRRGRHLRGPLQSEELHSDSGPLPGIARPRHRDYPSRRGWSQARLDRPTAPRAAEPIPAFAVLSDTAPLLDTPRKVGRGPRCARAPCPRVRTVRRPRSSSPQPARKRLSEKPAILPPCTAPPARSRRPQ